MDRGSFEPDFIENLMEKKSDRNIQHLRDRIAWFI
jgi:hypothetical protein